MLNLVGNTQDPVQKGLVNLTKVYPHINPADPLAKHVAAATLQHLLNPLALRISGMSSLGRNVNLRLLQFTLKLFVSLSQAFVGQVRFRLLPAAH